MKSKEKKQNTGLGVVFIFLVACIMLIAFLTKAFQIYKNSSFDGVNNYNIANLSSRGWKVISISPQNSMLTIIKISTKDEAKFKQLEIPVDLYSRLDEEIDKYDAKALLRSILAETSANPFDIFKINLFLKTTTLKSTESIEADIEDSKSLKMISENLSNPSFLREKLTIEVINATGEAGVGSLVTRLIANMGGNVILVSSANNNQKTSEIQTQEENSQTVKKISRILNVRVTKMTPPLSDVKIIVGEDLLPKFKQ